MAAEQMDKCDHGNTIPVLILLCDTFLVTGSVVTFSFYIIVRQYVVAHKYCRKKRFSAMWVAGDITYASIEVWQLKCAASKTIYKKTLQIWASN